MGWSGPMTHRQFEVWSTWLNMENNQPSRSDYYAMQIAFYVARSAAKHPNSINFKSFKLKFNETYEVKENQPLTDQDIINAQAMSLARIGKANIRLPDGTPITKKEILEMTMRNLEAKNKKEEPKQEARENIKPDVIIQQTPDYDSYTSLE